MSTEIRDRLDRAADAAGFSPSDPGAAIAAGTRIRRRQRFAAALTTTGVLAVGGVGVATIMADSPEAPDLGFGDPGGRIAAVAAGGPTDGYPDLVVRVRGTTIEGFGWPLQDQPVVSTPDGEVSFPPIDKVDAETMCLPMLNQAAPDVPDAAWHHSEAWIDDFPTRAGLVTTFEADFRDRTYFASCTLPGDHTLRQRPNLAAVPAPGDEGGLREHCGYLGHVDLRAWDVAATDSADGTVAAALVAPDGTFARCVLSEDVRQRVVQLSETASSDVVLVNRSGGVVTAVGRIDPDVARLTLEAEPGDTWDVPVRDGIYVSVETADEPFSATAYDAAGDVVEGAVDMVVPLVCFTSVELGDDGC